MHRKRNGAAGQRGDAFVKILIAVVLLALVGGFGLRINSWAGSRQNVELLTLVNPWNSVDTVDFSVHLTSIGNGQEADRRCVEELERMLGDCRFAGCTPEVYTAYISRGQQQELYRAEVDRLVALGASEEDAVPLAAQAVAYPGTSEHELGLAFDIIDSELGRSAEEQAASPTICWLMDNCWRYGFILRYPESAEYVTGVSFEPWHYRYVGSAAAEQIKLLDVTLEEYMSLFYGEEATIKFEN